jgi:hypothetical protein
MRETRLDRDVEIYTMKPNISVCYTPSSEPYSIYGNEPSGPTKCWEVFE